MSARDILVFNAEHAWQGGISFDDHMKRSEAEIDAYRAEVLREAAASADAFSKETEDAHTWWVVARWLSRLADGEDE
ncbi:hypothetical protein [Streptomyces sp. NPDC007063]|uniref:hypothetical protein n=1 Tax=Streptomyces sp. NPDC007063 TaxID=3364772 RepID=UPI0036752271